MIMRRGTPRWADDPVVVVVVVESGKRRLRGRRGIG